MLIFVFSWLSSLKGLQITSVQVLGADPDIANALRDAAQQNLQGSYIGMFPRSNILIYPKNAIVRSVGAASDRLSGVSVHRQGLNTLIISVNEKTPAALVCAGLPDFNGNSLSFDDSDSCYFADANGLIFEHAPSFSGTSYNRYYVPSLADSSMSSTSIVGAYATSTSEFTALQSFYAGVRAGGIDPAALLMKDGGEYELYAGNPSRAAEATSSLDDMAVIYFNDTVPFSEELANLLSFWNKMESSTSEPVRFSDIKLEFPPNIYYTEIK